MNDATRKKLSTITLFGILFLSISAFAGTDSGYIPVANLKGWAASAKTDEVKEVYRSLLVKLKSKGSTLTEENISDELNLIDNLPPKKLKTVALSLITKHMQVQYPDEFKDDVTSHLSKEGALSKITRFFNKQPDYELLLEATEKPQKEHNALCTGLDACTCLCTVSGLSVGGGVFGGMIGAFGGYLVYTFGFLIASGVAGPLADVYYSWPVILGSFGVGGLFGGTGGCILGSTFGCCAAHGINSQRKLEEQANNELIPGSSLINSVLTMPVQTV